MLLESRSVHLRLKVRNSKCTRNETRCEFSAMEVGNLMYVRSRKIFATKTYCFDGLYILRLDIASKSYLFSGVIYILKDAIH